MTKYEIDFILERLPSDPGVYIFKNAKGAPLYIGKATCIKKRVRAHFYKNASLNQHKESLLSNTADIATYPTSSEIEALVLESRLIKELRPRYNVVLRDDKQYFYVGFTKDIFPKIFLTHQPFARAQRQEARGKRQKSVGNWKLETGNSFVGPFTDGRALKQTLKLLRRVFPYCTCQMTHKRFCLNYQMGRDPGYCCAQSSKLKAQSALTSVAQFPRNPARGRVLRRQVLQLKSQNVKEYKNNISRIRFILSGHKNNVFKELEQKMKQSAEKRQFEKAAELRDQWEGAQNILAHRHVLEEKIVGTGSNFSYLFLMSRIKRIEGYDISNIQGKWAVGSMVVFSQDANGNFHPEKSEYRKFRIRTVRGANDPAMMKEVFKRRLIHKEWLFPDLIVVDGGKTQRNAALEALNALDKTTPVFGLAKREEELYTERGVIHLSSLPASYELLFRYIRDEAHRFAISYYRKLHRKTITTSI